MNFYDILAAKKWGGGIPTINFFDLLFAKSMGGGEQWQTYEGTLPATFNANGDDMRQYQVWGNSGGVGDKTVNLFDKSSEKVLGYINDQGAIVQGGTPVWTYDFFPIIGGTEYTYISYDVRSVTYRTIRVTWYDENKTFISRTFAINTADVARTVAAPSTAAYARLSVDSEVYSVMFNSGSTVLPYVPYGYEVDMSVSDGTTSTTAPVYIGDDPLGKDEYIDYQSQKVYRMIDGTLTPTDPPIPLPALPTCEGTTIVAYAGNGAVPEKVYFEYQGGKQS